MNETKLLSIGKTADILGVHIDTLREWDKEGKLVPVKTPGNHRRYKMGDIEAFCGIMKELKVDAGQVRVATYSRVSSHEQKQKGDLERQNGRVLAYCVKKNYHDVKSCSRKTYNYCNDYSWTFQYSNNDGAFGRDDIFGSSSPDLVALVFLETPQDKSGVLKAILPWPIIKKYLKDPKKESLIGLKKCLYYSDLVANKEKIEGSARIQN